jgi:hypothetical protein
LCHRNVLYSVVLHKNLFLRLGVGAPDVLFICPYIGPAAVSSKSTIARTQVAMEINLERSGNYNCPDLQYFFKIIFTDFLVKDMIHFQINSIRATTSFMRTVDS